MHKNRHFWSDVVGAGSDTLRATKVWLGLLLAGVWLSATAQEPQNAPAPSVEALQEFARTVSLRTAVRTGDAKRVEELLAANPFITVKGAADKLDVAFTTAQRAIERLERLKIVKQVGDAKRGRVYCADALLEILEEPAQLRSSKE